MIMSFSPRAGGLSGDRPHLGSMHESFRNKSVRVPIDAAFSNRPRAGSIFGQATYGGPSLHTD